MLRSSELLPELPVSPPCEDFIDIDYVDCSDLKSLDRMGWDHQWRDSGLNVSGYCKKLEEGFFSVAIPGVACFQINCKLQSIEVTPGINVSSSSVRHALLDRIIPMMVGQIGVQVIHASAVMLANGAVVAFVGDSGQGKSTLAASLVTSGATLLTDDCLLVEASPNSVSVVPSYKGLRLNDDSAQRIFGFKGVAGSVAHYSDKKRLALFSNGDDQAGRYKLDHLFLLAQSAETVNICSVTDAGGLAMLVKQQFFLDVKDKAQVSRQFRHIRSLLASGLPISRLSYPRSYDYLPQVENKLLAYLNASTKIS